ncbi:hypothetical protein Tco_0989437 [Tanacetum coccineum]|uniref:Uncharacterized protein n=1 Tax=Tanacetum coccineum TaxID=301880 RepID=A0ABQ5EU71_9ASTR
MGWVVCSDAVLESRDTVLIIIVMALRCICDAVSSYCRGILEPCWCSMKNVNPSSLTPSCEFLDPKKKLEVESWIENSTNVDLLADSDSEFEEEIEEEEKEEEDDLEYFDTFPNMEELGYHGILKNPRPSWVIFDKERPGSRKAHLLGDKQIPSVGVFDEKPDKMTIWLKDGLKNQDQSMETASGKLVMPSESHSDDVWKFVTPSGSTVIKEALETLAW